MQLRVSLNANDSRRLESLLNLHWPPAKDLFNGLKTPRLYNHRLRFTQSGLSVSYTEKTSPLELFYLTSLLRLIAIETNRAHPVIEINGQEERISYLDKDADRFSALEERLELYDHNGYKYTKLFKPKKWWSFLMAQDQAEDFVEQKANRLLYQALIGLRMQIKD